MKTLLAQNLADTFQVTGCNLTVLDSLSRNQASQIWKQINLLLGDSLYHVDAYGFSVVKSGELTSFGFQ
jgi:hypothetical protein